jgi:hypothetical protein
MKRFGLYLFSLLLLGCFNFFVKAQDDGENYEQKRRATVAVKKLISTDPLTRQRAAEELATLGAVEQKLLVEGYRLQEKDKRVKLALDWALYRMGVESKLYEVVKELGTSRRNQVTSYLVEYVKPNLLYPFLRADDKTLIGLLGVFARIGDAETLTKIEPYTRVLNPEIVSSAKYAKSEITKRLAEPQQPKQTRPRSVEGTIKPKS